MPKDNQDTITRIKNAITETNQAFQTIAPETDTQKLINAVKTESAVFQKHNTMFFKKENINREVQENVIEPTKIFEPK